MRAPINLCFTDEGTPSHLGEGVLSACCHRSQLRLGRHSERHVQVLQGMHNFSNTPATVPMIAACTQQRCIQLFFAIGRYPCTQHAYNSGAHVQFSGFRLAAITLSTRRLCGSSSSAHTASNEEVLLNSCCACGWRSPSTLRSVSPTCDGRCTCNLNSSRSCLSSCLLSGEPSLRLSWRAH